MKVELYFKKVILSGSETPEDAERIHELEQSLIYNRRVVGIGIQNFISNSA
jgi:hypothetical protein